MIPTFLAEVHLSHTTILHFGHCHRVGLNNPPASLPHFEQNPRNLPLHVSRGFNGQR